MTRQQAILKQEKNYKEQRAKKVGVFCHKILKNGVVKGQMKTYRNRNNRCYALPFTPVALIKLTENHTEQGKNNKYNGKCYNIHGCIQVVVDTTKYIHVTICCHIEQRAYTGDQTEVQGILQYLELMQKKEYKVHFDLDL